MSKTWYRNRQIEVVTPINVSETDRYLFESNAYEIHNLNILELEGATITYSGIVFCDYQIVQETIHGYADKFDSFCAHGINEISQAKNKYILKSNSCYLLIHNIWFNYYHWITESIPRLLLVKDRLDELVLLLPAHYKGIKYVQESLEAFNLKKIIYIPNKAVLKANKVIIPQLKPICHEFCPEVTNQIRSFYQSYVYKNNKSKINLGKKIYISRVQSRRRKVRNESDFVAILVKYGFHIIHAEHYSFFDQIAIASNANYLISIHGAGLTNIQFMKKGTSVMELHKRITNKSDHHSLCYWYLASSLEVNYFQQLCTPVDPEENFYTADLYADINLLEKNICCMCES